jgi:hypothetical protein
MAALAVRYGSQKKPHNQQNKQKNNRTEITARR